ncbi:putative outer membrane receptor [Yersinia enterocolitica]|nr:putative outer membrane receptor [Yersinia enterocolitica]
MNAGLTLFNTDFKDKITEVRRCTDSTGNASGQCMINGTAYKFISDRTNVDKAITRGVEATPQPHQYWRKYAVLYLCGFGG